jgi:NhaP-type Na+/H+ or K+/H+ antiporter
MSGPSGPAAVAVVAASVLAWSLLSVRFERWRISAAMLFVALGLVLTNGPLQVVDVHLHSHTIEAAAELALAMVLFTDASRVNFSRLRADAAVPSRLLFLGLPLAIAIGAVAALVVFHGVDGWIAVLVAVIVAPTDAALGAPVIEDEHVPLRIRRALNVESGLNDGLATPIFTIVLALAVSHGDGHGAGPVSELVAVVGAIALGIVAGALGGMLLGTTERRGWSSHVLQPVATIALALLVYGLALAWGLNGFVAAFVAGISFGASWRPARPDDADLAIGLACDVGGILSAVVWLMFGAMLVPALDGFDWQAALFAVLALTLVRGVAVAISLIGVGFDRATVRFLAWFGPRGLASVVFCLIAYDELIASDARFVLTTAVTVVLASVIAHGVSAGPLAERYGRSHPALEGEEGGAAIPSRALSRRRMHA